MILLLGDCSIPGGKNELNVGSSGISGKMKKGAVRQAESQGAIVGGGKINRKGVAMTGDNECKIEELKGR